MTEVEAAVEIRRSSRNGLACGECGAEARWFEHPQGEDGWRLVCGHRGEPVVVLITTTVTLADSEVPT